MCTAISYLSNNHYFGRNLDLEYNYNETVTITPRQFPFVFRKTGSLTKHYAIIGIANVVNNYPLYYDAVNEHGLAMAGLHFPGNAIYHPIDESRINITPFEFTPWILCRCKTVSDARAFLRNANLVKIPFNDEYPLSPLHWIIADKHESVVIESTQHGIAIYDNPVGVLTNNPTFDFHLYNLTNYVALSNQDPDSRFSGKVPLHLYSRGMGALGMPGDLSSASRFIRASFTKLNSVDDGSEADAVNQCFHILGSVTQQRGCVKVGDRYEETVYSCCCNTDKGIYYYKTYSNSQITGVDLFREDLDNKNLVNYPLRTDFCISWQN